MALMLVTSPAREPMTLAEAKDHLRVDGADDDALISELISAARRQAEESTRRALITQTWRLFLDRWLMKSSIARDWREGVTEGADIRADPGSVEIPRPPLQQVASVKTYDESDAATTWAASNYFVDTASQPGRLVRRTGASWPTPGRAANGIEIEFAAGYGDNPGDVPEALRQGMLLLVGHLYEHREAVLEVEHGRSALTTLPLGVQVLWGPYRVVTL